MKKIIAALLGLAVLEGVASAQTPPARIAYDSCYAWDYDFVCNIVAGGSGVAWAWGQDSALGPKWSPDGSRVAFVTGDILVVTLADGAIANLTNPLGGSSPAWSSDGGKIAFTSNRDGLTELYVMNADGSSVRRLTDHIGFNGRPAWSPYSSQIAFGCELEIGNQDICTINANGSGLVRLTTDPARDYGAVFSHAGLLAFVTDRFGPETIAVLEDGGAVRAVREGTDPAWSPDGTRIALISIDDVFVVAAAGGNAINVTNDGLGYYGPVWSPDGSELAFGGTSIAGYTGKCYWGEGAHPADDFCMPAFGVYVANADGSAHHLLDLGGNPDWFVPSSGRPVSSFTHQCSGSVCDFDGSGSSDSDGTIASYAWQFGDGTSGSGPAPHHVYAIGDRYVVTLTVTDDTGTTGAMNITIDANAPPVAALTAGCSGNTCTFNASGSSDPDGTIAFYSVSFGDEYSTGFMTTPTASHAYKTGTFTATLYVQDNAGAYAVQTTTVTVINLPPVAAFTYACNRLTCSFDASASDPDGNIHSYLWTFSDGSGGSGATAIRQFAAGGTYTVTLTVFDNSGEKTIVSQTLSIANNVPPIAAFTETCGSLTCTFNGTGSFDSDGAVTAYSWAFGDGTTGVGAIVTHAYANPGTYNVTLTVADNSAGTNTQSKAVTLVRTMHVGDLDLVGASQQTAWTAVVTVAVHDGSHTPLAGATVSGSWSNGLAGSCTTNAVGQCTLSNAAIPKKIGSITFTVVNTTHQAAMYRSADSHDPDGDSTGVTIRVSKP